jgi:leader peptidase (prepilin peptidase)/N-methyltransferase
VDVALGLLAFWPALALGSFLNVVAARVPLRRSVVRPASACMSCGTELAWRDNVPVLSWLWLRGRCRTCGVRISAVYPLVELATAGLVAACFVTFGLSGDAFVASFFCVVLVVLSAIDLEHRIVPNRIVLPAAAIVLVSQTALHPSPEWTLGALGASGFLLVAALAYPAGMGMGDVKLAAVLGLYLGAAVVPALLVALAAGTVAGAAIVARRGVREGRKAAIPFGPFLALGGVVGLVAGRTLIEWFAGL